MLAGSWKWKTPVVKELCVCGHWYKHISCSGQSRKMLLPSCHTELWKYPYPFWQQWVREIYAFQNKLDRTHQDCICVLAILVQNYSSLKALGFFSFHSSTKCSSCPLYSWFRLILDATGKLRTCWTNKAISERKHLTEWGGLPEPSKWQDLHSDREHWKMPVLHSNCYVGP